MSKPAPPARTPLASRLGAILAIGLVAWAALVGLWYYGSENHIVALKALSEYGLGLVPFILTLLAGGAALWLLARREHRGQLPVWAGPALLGLLFAGAFCVPGLRERALDLLLAAGVLAAGVGFGLRLLGWLKVRARGAAEALAWGGAIGLGLLSFVYAVLGMLGLFSAWMLAGVALVFLIVGGRDLLRLGGRLGSGTGRFWRRAGPAGSTLALLLLALFLWRLAHCFAPPLLGVADYDALEYHLAAPMEWLRLGRIAFLPHNTYANMPSGGEMLYAPGIALLPGNFSGYYFTKLMGLGAAALVALAVHAAGRRLAGRNAGLLAAAIFFCGLWLADLLGAPFVEPFLMLYATVAWSAFAVFAVNRLPPTAYRLLVVIGLAAGAAAATKYPAAVFVAAPIGLAALAVWLVRARDVRRALAALALVGALSLALAAPWYAKNWMADGNPVYPLASRVFPSRHWDASKDARFRAAHRPKESPGRATWKVVWESRLASPLLLAFLPLAPLGLWGRRRGRTALAGVLAAGALVYILGWALFTHQIERFLYPAFGLLAVMGAVGAARAGGRLAPWVVLAGVLLAAPGEIFWTRVSRASPDLGTLSGLTDENVFLRNHLGGYWRAVAAVNALPAGSRVLLVGEARAALFRVPTLYAVVFDTHPLEAALAEAATADELAGKLRALGVSHVYWNWAEFLRLRESYAAKLPDGTPIPGLFNLSAGQFRLLADFERDYLEPLGAWGDGGLSPLTGRPARVFELWRVRSEPQKPSSGPSLLPSP